jgi:KDO2-lipid IV(A) lauroyltransferase
MEAKNRANIFFRLLESFLLAVFYFTRFLSRLLPPSFICAIFNFIGDALFYSRRGMREHLLDNLREALPEVTDDQELMRIGRQACSALFLPMLDLIFLTQHDRRSMDELSVEGMEHLDRADAEGKGVILFSPHLGALSAITAIMARVGKPYTPLVLPPSSSPVPRYITTMALYAQSLGCDKESPAFWTGRDTIVKVRQHLGKGKRVGLSFDLQGESVIDFFGRPTALASGIAHFAYDTGAPIVPVCLLRGTRPLERRLAIYEPLTYNLNGNRSSDIITILSEVIRSGEELIRDAPGQWMGWFGLRQWRKQAEQLLKNQE